MDQEWSVPGWAVLATLLVLVLLVVVLVVALLRSRARTTATLIAARTDAVALQAQVDAIEGRLAQQQTQHAERGIRRDEHEFVITRLGEGQPEPDRTPAPVVGGPLFADLVLRESAVQAASLAAGLRRALAPEARHRIRFAMKREVKRARKQRRTDLRRARRQAA